MARKKGSTDYSIEKKLEAIRLIDECGMTQAEVTEELGIRDPKRVKNWLWQYRREGVPVYVTTAGSFLFCVSFTGCSSNPGVFLVVHQLISS